MGSSLSFLIWIGAGVGVATVSGYVAFRYYQSTHPFRGPGAAFLLGALSYFAKDDGPISPYYGIHQLKLIKKQTLVEEIPGKICPVRIFTFALPNPTDSVEPYINLGLGDAVRIHFGLKPDGSDMMHKPYSPTRVSDKGEIDLTIKIYPGGLNSKMLDALVVGKDTVGISGPHPNNWMQATRLPGPIVNLVAYGIGMTEIFQLAKAELEKGDARQVRLLYANRYAQDAIYKEELAQLVQLYQDRFTLTYIFSRDEVKDALKGRVDAQVLKDVFSLPTSTADPRHCEQRFQVVGSQEMIQQTWNKHLKTFDYNQKDHMLLIIDMFKKPRKPAAYQGSKKKA